MVAKADVATLAAGDIVRAELRNGRNPEGQGVRAADDGLTSRER
jgi:hypothetical protein